MAEALTCSSCAFFKDRHRKFRIPGNTVKYTCKSKGVSKFNDLCESFEIKPSDTTPDYQQMFFNMIAHSFTVEQDAERAMDLIIKTMKEKGFEVPLAKKKFRSYIDKLTVLSTLSRMVDVMGLTLHKEAILDQEIVKLFQTRIPITAKKV